MLVSHDGGVVLVNVAGWASGNQQAVSLPVMSWWCWISVLVVVTFTVRCFWYSRPTVVLSLVVEFSLVSHLTSLLPAVDV